MGERTGSESAQVAHQQIADERLAQGGSLGQFKVAERLARVAEVTVGESKRIVSGPVLRRELDSLREVLDRSRCVALRRDGSSQSVHGVGEVRVILDELRIVRSAALDLTCLEKQFARPTTTGCAMPSATGNTDLFLDVSIPASTRRTWARGDVRPVVASVDVELEVYDLLEQVDSAAANSTAIAFPMVQRNPRFCGRSHRRRRCCRWARHSKS